MKGTRLTTTMKIVKRKKRRGRYTASICDIMFTSKKKDVGVSDLKDVVCDKLLVSRVEGQLSTCKVERVMNRLLDNADLESKNTCRTAWNLMWDNRGPKVWALDYRE